MKKLSAFLFFAFLSGALYAADAPPYKVGSPPADENFRDVYEKVSTHRHDREGSERLRDTLPDADSTYGLGAIGSEWGSIDVDSATVAESFKALDGGTTTFLIYEGGIIDMSKQSAARAYRAANVSNGVGTSATKVSLSSETFDTQGEFDSTTNYRFTATRAGIYPVSACASSTGLGAANLRFNVYIYVNGAEHSRGWQWSAGTGDVSACVSDRVQLAVSGYIELYVNTTAAAAKDLAGGSSLTFLAVGKGQ